MQKASCPARLRPATGAAEVGTKQPDTTIIVLPSCVFIVCRFYILESRCLFEKPPYSSRTERSPNNMHNRLC